MIDLKCVFSSLNSTGNVMNLTAVVGMFMVIRTDSNVQEKSWLLFQSSILFQLAFVKRKGETRN